VTFDLYGHLMPGSEAEAASLLEAYLERKRANVSRQMTGTNRAARRAPILMRRSADELPELAPSCAHRCAHELSPAKNLALQSQILERRSCLQNQKSGVRVLPAPLSLASEKRTFCGAFRL
jgi:hypothetical protein